MIVIKFSLGEDKIEDILVLYLDRGKDYFLFVFGNYLFSCFGFFIYILCYMRQLILDLLFEIISELILMLIRIGDDGSQLESFMEIFKEFWMMVDYLY